VTVETATPETRTSRTAAEALAAAVEHLRGLQDPAGWWKG
jgi:squalene-hopene/tetraprenyl-beta-curcumene cyclase